MILIRDMMERLAVCYIVHIVYPSIRALEFILGRNLLDDDD